MPALPSPGKVIRLDLFFTKGVNTRVRDRIFFSYSGPGPTVGDLNTWLATVNTQWSGHMSGQQTTDTTLTQLEATDLASNTGAQAIAAVASAGTLTGTGVNAAAAVCLIIKFKIARRYRGGHPRFYMPGPSMGNLQTTETWTSAYASGAASAFSAFIAAAVTTPPTNLGTMAHVNVSYFQGFHNVTFPSGRTHAVATPKGTPTVDPVIAYVGNPIIGSQRRRNQQSA